MSYMCALIIYCIIYVLSVIELEEPSGVLLVVCFHHEEYCCPVLAVLCQVSANETCSLHRAAMAKWLSNCSSN
jgi:hypothetical protein